MLKFDILLSILFDVHYKIENSKRAEYYYYNELKAKYIFCYVNQHLKIISIKK